ncbi:Bardet-Biedl syndrome 9 [Strigomonas culicis]|uniref:Bardet-Biedl syndrome 9 n=1 Tax=Strigomonas culicis TaxID=28005 RepID=S9VQT5_9TRYP|nr:Bardet-Biedl syndrome 9 [Strigomonas culicis]|eukprot:EPY25565.1 Bardet-Biedl syndrome 9 [Strigomonas culicis]
MGSLFQLRDFWYTSFPQEEFGVSALTTGDVDNMQGADKIIVGSFQGHLRIISPSSHRGEMQASDILYEKKYDEPILQVECGPYEPIIDGVTQNLLAILFPRKLIFLRVLCCGEGAEEEQKRKKKKDGTDEEKATMPLFYYECNVYFETTFEHTTYNFVSGRFGKTWYKQVCVQSMDGELTFVDHNKVLYKRFIPPTQFLVPGCLAYSVAKDALLTNNSSLFLMCYSYTNIVNSLTSERKEEPGGPHSPDGMRLSPTWAFNLGDDAVAIKVCYLTRGGDKDEDIVVLCPYIMYVLSQSGHCTMTRRLNVEAVSLMSYTLQGLVYSNLLIGFLNQSISVYSDTALEWSAKLVSGNALCMSVGTLCGVQGMIVTLTGDGRLAVNYLGTDPAEGPVQPLESKAASYTEMCDQLKRIQYEIKNMTGETNNLLKTVKDTIQGDQDSAPILISGAPTTAAPPPSAPAPPSPTGSAPATAAQAPAAPAPASEIPAPKSAIDTHLSLQLKTLTVSPTPENKLTVSLQVSLDRTALADISGIDIHLRAVEPIVVETNYKSIASIAVGETVTVPITIGAQNDRDNIIPSSLEVIAVAVFKTRAQVHHSVQASFMLPLSLVAKAVPPVKNTAFSIQLNTDKSPPPSLLNLFPDMAVGGSMAANVLSIEYINGADATLLVSKNAARFKLQASTMEALWLFASELMRRVRNYYNEPSLVFDIPDELPVKDLGAVIDTHLKIRGELVSAIAQLEEAAVFYRAVQKRLLVHFRDRNPASLDSLDLLLKRAYTLMQKRTDAIGVAQGRQRQACAMLNCCVRLFFVWLAAQNREVFQHPEDLSVLEALFACDITDEAGVGWEET